jgi:hypothetical protein
MDVTHLAHGSIRPTRHMAGACVALLAGSVAAGCDSAPTTVPSPPSGGQAFSLSLEVFTDTIHPILVARGCNTGGDCHGGGIRGTFRLSPPDDPDIAFDFAETSLQVNPYSSTESPILTKPLAESAGGEPHSHEPFATTDDPDYQAILAWIRDGEFR